MRKAFALLFAPSLLLLLTSSCGSKNTSSTPKLDYQYTEDAIQLNLRADHKLNLFQGRPHTLSMCLYQLTDPNAFNQSIEDEKGLYKLLECERFDTSVAASKNFTIQPGQRLQVSLDRAEGAEYVAVVAGYFSFQKDHMVRLFKVPVVVERKWWNPLYKKRKVGLVTVNLIFGPQWIQEVGGKQ